MLILALVRRRRRGCSALLLLIGVMVQGILGGLRVYLNALYGSDLAAIHGVFSQVVLAIAVTRRGPDRRMPASDRRPSTGGSTAGRIATAVVVFGQIVVGAILRHTDSPLGPRLHLLGRVPRRLRDGGGVPPLAAARRFAASPCSRHRSPGCRFCSASRRG